MQVLAKRPTEPRKLLHLPARTICLLSELRVPPSRLLLVQFEYRFHDATGAHIAQSDVGIFQTVSGNQSG